MEHYKIIVHKDSLSHARKSKSKYSGGFVKKGNRSNNSKAYNHDYYMKNKEKWSLGLVKRRAKFKVDNLINSVRSKAINTITDLMVDISMAYMKKMLSDDNLGALGLDQIAYDTVMSEKVSEAINSQVNNAVDQAMGTAASRVVEKVTAPASNAVEQKKQEVAKSVANEASNFVNDLLKRKR